MKAALPFDADEAPILDERFVASARGRIGTKVLREATGMRARRGRLSEGSTMRLQQPLRLSPEVRGRCRGIGKGWQARIDEVPLACVARDGDRRAS